TKSVSVGTEHGCAVKTDGTVVCWGNQQDSVLGTASGTQVSPFTITGVSDAKSVASGRHDACAVTNGGSVYCWGDNANGQLGRGTTGAGSPTPTAVTGISTAVSVSLGFERACAVLSNGQVQCWGDNADGELGDGTSTDRSSPVTVKAALSGSTGGPLT